MNGQTEDAALSVRPPYPNLGPEPFTETRTTSGLWVALALIGFVSLAALLARARRRTPAKSPVPKPVDDGQATTVVSLTDAECAQAGASALRELLVGRFGESWRAFTSEEIETGLHDRGDHELASRLRDYLHLADLAKFSGPRFEDTLARRVGDVGAVDWDGWLASLSADLAAGARSINTGK